MGAPTPSFDQLPLFDQALTGGARMSAVRRIRDGLRAAGYGHESLALRWCHVAEVDHRADEALRDMLERMPRDAQARFFETLEAAHA